MMLKLETDANADADGNVDAYSRSVCYSFFDWYFEPLPYTRETVLMIDVR